MRYTLAIAAALIAGAQIAAADILTQQTSKSVPDAVSSLKDAVAGAGGTVFAVVDHGAGAMTVGKDISASQLVIFGNPKIGTPAMEQNILAGLALPLSVLVYEQDGMTWLAWEDPAERFEELLPAPLAKELTEPMAGALKKLTSKAAR